MDTSVQNETTGVVIVDHGSRRAEANAMIECFAQVFREASGFAIVEHAHMELAEPDIGQAVDRCVARGAKRVVVALFFLSPGRHSRDPLLGTTGPLPWGRAAGPIARRCFNPTGNAVPAFG